MCNVIILYVYIMYCDQIIATGFFFSLVIVLITKEKTYLDIFGDLNSSASFKM